MKVRCGLGAGAVTWQAGRGGRRASASLYCYRKLPLLDTPGGSQHLALWVPDPLTDPITCPHPVLQSLSDFTLFQGSELPRQAVLSV